ncbi:MAG: 50S ribosomal protein L13 [Mycoplasmataceae bacterium]|nr:MAG: 50S ribosomal protein L13 [Mycoplasmataceae bacterium]
MEKNNLSQNTSNPSVKKDRGWYFFDLSGKVLGQAAVKISKFLRGKNDRNFIYNLDLGNHVVLINSDKLVLTGNKANTSIYYDHSGYPGGLRERKAGLMLEKYSVELVHRVVKGLMPHNRLSRQQLKRLFVYSDSNHLHKAQKDKFLVIN